MLKGFTRKFKPLDLLSEGQVDQIWDGILRVLEKPGLKFDVQSPEAFRIFDAGGCKVDRDTKMVRFPREVVTECLRLCPSSFRLESRDPNYDLEIGLDKVHISSGPGTQYIDIETFQPRTPTRNEYYDAVTVYDALPNLHLFHPLSPNSTFEGVPPAMHSLETYAAKLRNSCKSIWGGSSVPGEHVFHIEMDKVVGAKGLRGNGATVPPLGWHEAAVSCIIARVKEGFPSHFCTGPTWGASSPATLAGSVISMSAEAMGAVVLAQLLRPGHPVLVGSLAFPQNMRWGSPLFGNIAIGLEKGVFSQVWRRWGIPTASAGASIPNSKCIDFQSGYEKGMLALSNAICGDSMIWIHGGVHGELTAHPVQAILDDDIAGSVGRFLEGVEVSEETMAVELIQQVGAGPDFFLNKAHTRKWWRKEQYIPAVADITTIPEWLKGGKKKALDLAKEKMAQILETHKVAVPLTPGQDEELERILADARKFFKAQGRL